MDHLEERSVDELRQALDEVQGSKPTQRLVAAIAYKRGVSQTELAEWFGVDRRTIYNWLQRLDAAPLERAAEDDRRPGRPRKVSGDEREEIVRTLRAPPNESGYDVEEWTPALVRAHLRDAYDVEYSLSSCRRLLREAGVR